MSWLSKVIKSNAKGLVRNVAAPVASLIPGVGGMAATALTRSVQPRPGAVVHGPTVQSPGGWRGSLGSITLPGGFGSVSLGPQGGGRRGRVQMVEGQCPKGYHPNKSPSADGSPARSFCVRNRRTNYSNGRAADRAGKRLRGTVKRLRRWYTLVEARPAKGKFIPKKGRR